MPGRGVAFRLIAAHKRWPGPAADRQGQLPGQVVRVMQAGVQSLAAERARQVAGVAEQEPSLTRQP